MGLLGAAGVAHAQDLYPSKPVRFVNNFPPGGPSDILARSVAQVLQGELKQPFVVENKPGAAGNLGRARWRAVRRMDIRCCSASIPLSR